VNRPSRRLFPPFSPARLRFFFFTVGVKPHFLPDLFFPACILEKWNLFPVGVLNCVFIETALDLSSARKTPFFFSTFRPAPVYSLDRSPPVTRLPLSLVFLFFLRSPLSPPVRRRQFGFTTTDTGYVSYLAARTCRNSLRPVHAPPRFSGSLPASLVERFRAFPSFPHRDSSLRDASAGAL